ncbi:MAG: hypothetical protein Q4B12_02940 [Bowdeniella nasicola]|nr:hypothetical protein [Bowdeniella nasicola]
MSNTNEYEGSEQEPVENTSARHAAAETGSPYDTEPAGEAMPHFQFDRQTREDGEQGVDADRIDLPGDQHNPEEIFGPLPTHGSAQPAASRQDEDTPTPQLKEEEVEGTSAGESDFGWTMVDDDVATPQAQQERADEKRLDTVPADTVGTATSEPALLAEPAAQADSAEPARHTELETERPTEQVQTERPTEQVPIEDDELESTMVRRTSLWNHAEEDPAAPVAEPTTAVPVVPASKEPTFDDDILAGEELEEPRSRAWAHVGSLFGVLLLLPVAWYLLADAGARFTLAVTSPWASGVVNMAAVGEFIGGLVVLGLIAYLIRCSSVGAFVTGTVVTVAGACFILLPQLTARLMGSVLIQLRQLGAFGNNLYHHLVFDGSMGRLALYGALLIAAGYISASARRAGRRRERLEAAYKRRTR